MQDTPQAVFRRVPLSLVARIVVLSAILIGALVLRTYNMRNIGIFVDEQITRTVVSNIWHGHFSNNWRLAGVAPPFNIDSYNFSSYMYADALFTGRPKRNSVRLDRWFSAITGTAAIYLFYLLALRLFGFEVALLALAILAVTPILVQDSHYGRPESFATLLCATVYMFAVPRRNAHTRMSLIGASSFCVGLLIACKVSMVPLILIPLLCLVFRGPLDIRSVSVWIGSTIGGILAGVPDAFFHPGRFWSGVQALRHQYANGHPPHSLMNSTHSFPLWTDYFWQTLGPIFCILFAIGIIAFVRRRQYFYLAILAGPLLIYFVLFGMQRAFFERNSSHVVPLMAILASVGLVSLCSTIRQRPRVLVMVAVALLLLSRPAQVSAKLVFVAMGNNWEERTRDYEKLLLKTQGLPVELTSELLSPEQVEDLKAIAIGSEHDTVVRIVDFHDDFTRKFLPELQTCTGAHEVGYVPSVFPGFFSVNTMLVYHAPAFHYLRLSPPEQLQIGGFTFVSWRRVRQPITASAFFQQSWIENGIYPDVAAPTARDRFFGSYTAAGDSNRGSIQIGPLDVRGLSQVAIPIVTGPITAELSVSVLDHATGLSVGTMSPPPVLRKWAAWQVSLANVRSGQIDVVAKDDGSGWGQWLGVGFPLRLDSSGPPK